jgi:diguanylate cyclase (GGDEF)-like protein
VLVALWAALRRPRSLMDRDEMLEQILGQLSAIDERMNTAAPPASDSEGGLGPAINETLDLGEVLQRTLAATWAIPDVDGGIVRVRLADGTYHSECHGLLVGGATEGQGGPPDGSSFAAGLISWQGSGPDGLRSGLVVPLGDGSLAVYSREANAFGDEAAQLLTSIARRAEPAVQNAFRYLDVQQLAATDARTGLGSALAFAEALPREVSAAQRHGRPLCLLELDLDDFGRINKEHARGLAAGDDVLTEFGERVRATIRGSDSAFRNSGGADEFFLILPETTRQDATLLYHRLAFEMAARPFGDVDPVTMSAGIAELRAEDTPESLQSRAGAALTRAKQAGKDQHLTDADE